jgi:hypothetical protein
MRQALTKLFCGTLDARRMFIRGEPRRPRHDGSLSGTNIRATGEVNNAGFFAVRQTPLTGKGDRGAGSEGGDRGAALPRPPPASSVWARVR